MQYFIFFDAGVGGDGFSNLIEHANNVYPSDGKDVWRQQYIVDGRSKFFNPKWSTEPQAFRADCPASDPVLHPEYISLIESGKNTVIPVHYEYYINQINSFKYKDYVLKDQIKICVYASDYNRFRKDYMLKCFSETKEPFFMSEQNFQRSIMDRLEDPLFDYRIDIDRAWKDWDYLNQCLIDLGIDLDRSVYEHYIQLVANKNKQSLFVFPVGGRGDFVASIIYGNKLSLSYQDNEIYFPEHPKESNLMKSHGWTNCEFTSASITPDTLPNFDADKWLIVFPTFEENFNIAYLNWYKKFRSNDTIRRQDLVSLIELNNKFSTSVCPHKDLFDYVIEFKNLFDIEFIKNLYKQINEQELTLDDIERININIELNKQILQTCPFDHTTWQDLDKFTPANQLFQLKSLK